AKLAAAKTRQPPGIPSPPPLPTNPADWERRLRKTKTRPSPQPSRRLSDSVASASMSDSVASTHAFDKLKALNEQRAARRAEKRTGLKCQTCGKPLDARRATARYCSPT